MIELHFTPSPNTWKVSIMLEECGLPYRVVPVDLSSNDLSDPAFLRISPNGRVPAIVDRETGQTVFESGAILVYLAERTGRFLAPSGSARIAAFEWLFWQMSALGPVSGQVHHFRHVAPGNDYSLSRFTKECARLYAVLEQRLESRQWLAGEYSIADIACWGWVWFNGEIPSNYPNIARWAAALAARPAVERGRRAGFEVIGEAGRSQLSGAWYGAADGGSTN